MQVFLSYASEQSELAHDLAQRLKSAGIGVFFDRESLAPTDPYDKLIRDAVTGADAFVFLASPDSLRPGAYTLTELGFAQECWPEASGRVLTVLTGGSTIESLPPYLRSVSVLQPVGDAIAETVAAVSKLAERARKTLWKRIAIGGLALLVLISILTFTLRKGPSHEIRDVAVRKADGGFQFTARLRNSGSEAVTTVSLRAEADKAGIRFPSSMEWFQLNPGEESTSAFLAQLTGRDGTTPFNWRLCWGFVSSSDLAIARDVKPIERFIAERSQTVCSTFRPWSG